LNKSADQPGGQNGVKLEKYIKQVNLDAVVHVGGVTGADTVFIG
jgi:hypothetical protein